jgi:phage tail P2-like protein
MTADLLPPKAAPLERRTAQGLAQIERVPIPIRDLHDPDRCPEPLLPYLAWERSVDRWDNAWPERTKREVIKASPYIHRHKGTIGALRRVVEPLGYLIRIVEWWQTDPPGPRGTFELEIGTLGNGISEELYDALVLFIEDAKPASRHITRLDIALDTRVPAFYGCALTDGDVLDIFPWQPADIDIHVAAYQAVTDHTIDILDVYLNG